MGGGGGGKLLVSTGSLPAPARVGAWVTRLGGGIEAPTVTGGPNLLLRGAEAAAADEAPLPLTAVGSDPFLTHGILPTKAAFFLAGGPGSGEYCLLQR